MYYGFDYWNADHYFGDDQHEGIVYYWQACEQPFVCREMQWLFIWNGRFDQ